RLGAALERGALEPLDRLGPRLHLPQPETGDQLLALGERAVDHRALPAVEAHTRAAGAGLQPVAGQHHAGLHQLLVVLAHRLEQRGVRQHAGFAVLVRFHDYHASHRRLSRESSLPRWRSHGYDERRGAGSTRPARIFATTILAITPWAIADAMSKIAPGDFSAIRASAA